MKFRARVIPSGNATAVQIPANIVDALGSGTRPFAAHQRLNFFRGVSLVECVSVVLFPLR
jgi:hypothetical protein